MLNLYEKVFDSKRRSFLIEKEISNGFGISSETACQIHFNMIIFQTSPLHHSLAFDAAEYKQAVV